jgi:hypothetical protein
MIEKVNSYLDQALGCSTLVMATLLHLVFLLAAFEECFPEKKDKAEKLLNSLVQDCKKKLKAKKNPPLEIHSQDGNNNNKKPPTQVVNLFNQASTKAENNKMMVYLTGGEIFEIDPNDKKLGFIRWKGSKIEIFVLKIYIVLFSDFFETIGLSSKTPNPLIVGA